MATLIVKGTEFMVPDMFYAFIHDAERDKVDNNVLHGLLINIERLGNEMAWFYIGYVLGSGKDIITNLYIADNMVAGMLHRKEIDQHRK